MLLRLKADSAYLADLALPMPPAMKQDAESDVMTSKMLESRA